MERIEVCGTDRRVHARVAVVVIGMTLAVAASGCGKSGEEYAVNVTRGLDRGKVTATRGTMETIGRALEAVSFDRGGYPAGTSIQDAMAAIVPAQLRAPVTADAWGQLLLYRSDGRGYTLASPGGDGREGTDDDLVMTDGRFTRIPSASGP